MGTKGTWRRPAAVPDEELDARWARIFPPGATIKVVLFHSAAGGDCPKCGPEVAEPDQNR